jgi:hypothetical protein
LNVAVIGASDDPEKYSYLAVKLLKEKGYRVFPVHPRIKQIEGISVYRSIEDVPEPIDTVSIYVSAEISSKIMEGILKKSPRRIIFNPGAENPDAQKKAANQGIKTLNGCTLVLLKTGQF